MSPIWRNASGDIRMTASGAPELVRMWSYKKIPSDCGPLPAWIYIIACDPPECVLYTNTNLDETGRQYLRQTCGEWGGGSHAGYNYAWPADVPNCPYPDGVTIEAAEDCGDLVYLCVTDDGGEDFSAVDESCGMSGQFDKPYSFVGNMGRGPWGITCWSSWQGCGGNLSITCEGAVSYGGSTGFGYLFWSGTGTPIAIDTEGLPLGNSLIPVYITYWNSGIPSWFFYRNLTITVSKC